jgi:hypothetical protein
MKGEHSSIPEKYTLKQIAEYIKETGTLPTAAVPSFWNIEKSLKAQGKSLADLMVEHGFRPYKNKRSTKRVLKSKITEELILKPIKQYQKDYKQLPFGHCTKKLKGTDDLTFRKIGKALYYGSRGLETERLTLRKFLIEYGFIEPSKLKRRSKNILKG